MVARIERKESRRKPSDEELLARAAALNDTWLGGLATPSSVRWVSNQKSRWGSCTPGDRSIRLSERLQQMPPWVVDYVLIHELAHLLEPGHGAEVLGVGRPLSQVRAGQGLSGRLVDGGADGAAGRLRRGRLTRAVTRPYRTIPESSAGHDTRVRRSCADPLGR